MRKEKKLSLRLGLLAGLVSLALLGSTAGSLAWYAYSRTATLSFVGTTVASSSLLNIGLVDNEGYFSQSELTSFNLERKNATSDPDSDSIVWSKSRNGFSLLAIRHYLAQAHYAVSTLKPVTTGSMLYNEYNGENDKFVLYRSPEFSETSFVQAAEKDAYVVLPFAFRVLDEDSQYVTAKNVWLTDAVVSADSNAEGSVRVFVDGANHFLMKPSDARNTVSGTKVGGILSLGPNEYYDFDGDNKEYCYGEFTNTLSYSLLQNEEYDVLSNDNHVEDTTEATTFYGKHSPGVLVPDIDAAQPKEQKHAGVGLIKPSVRANGQLYHDETNGNGYPIATTNGAGNIGYATFTIFIEGWDHNVIDQKAGYEFNLGLKFEIDRI